KECDAVECEWDGRELVAKGQRDALAGPGAQHQGLDGHGGEQLAAGVEIAGAYVEDGGGIAQRAEGAVRARVVDEPAAWQGGGGGDRRDVEGAHGGALRA